MPCGRLGWCGDSIHVPEKLAGFCAMSAIVSSIVIILLFSVGVGMGLGYNYCLVKKKTADAQKLRMETKKIAFASSTEINFDEFDVDDTAQVQEPQTTTEDIVYEDVTYVYAGWAGIPFQSQPVLIKPHHLKRKIISRVGNDNESTTEGLPEPYNFSNWVKENFDYYDPEETDNTPFSFNNTNMSSLIEHVLSQKDNVTIKFVRL